MTEEQQNKCEHLMLDPITNRPSKMSKWGHMFCPNCGEKL